MQATNAVDNKADNKENSRNSRVAQTWEKNTAKRVEKRQTREVDDITYKIKTGNQKNKQTVTITFKLT